MSKREDLTGQRFGRLIVLEFAHNQGGTHWRCLCDCGNKTTVRSNSLKGGATHSCGCLIRENNKANPNRYTHGQASKSTLTQLYTAWINMKARCYNNSNRQFHVWGGRGITVCDRWRNSFVAFHEDMGDPPTPQHSIDRIDVNGNYEPNNCRWATPQQQGSNRRNIRSLTYKGETRGVSEWSRKLDIPISTIANRMGRNLPPEQCLSRHRLK